MAKPILPFIFDLETTDTDIEKAQIVQVAAVTADFSNIKNDPIVKPRTVFSTLVNPNCPIPEAASAVHGIKDEDVVWSPGQVTALKTMALLIQAYERKYKVVLAGHNIERYDVPIIKRILPGAFEKYDTIDTYTAAVRTDPLADQKLGPYYEYCTKKDAVDAHDAAADCHMVAHILAKLLYNYFGDIQGYIEWLIDPVVWEVMPYGKHKGQKSCEVPVSYFKWCQKNFTETHKDFEATILHCLGDKAYV